METNIDAFVVGAYIESYEEMLEKFLKCLAKEKKQPNVILLHRFHPHDVDIEDMMCDNLRYKLITTRFGKQYYYFGNMVFEKLLKKFTWKQVAMYITKQLGNHVIIHDDFVSTLHYPIDFSALIHCKDVLQSNMAPVVPQPSVATVPQTPQIVTNLESPSAVVTTQAGGVPDMFGHISGAWQNFSTAVGNQYYHCSPNIQVNPGTVAGTLVFSFTYRDVYNDWMTAWEKYHEMYGGSIKVKLRVIGAATYVGELVVGFYYGPKANKALTLNDLLLYKPTVMGVSQFQEADFEFFPVHQNHYYFTTLPNSEPPSEQVRLVGMLQVPLNNAFPTDTIAVSVEVLSKPGTWYAIRPTLTNAIEAKIPSSLSWFEDKTLDEVFDKLNLKDYRQGVRMIVNSATSLLDKRTGGCIEQSVVYNPIPRDAIDPILIDLSMDFSTKSTRYAQISLPYIGGKPEIVKSDEDNQVFQYQVTSYRVSGEIPEEINAGLYKLFETIPLEPPVVPSDLLEDLGTQEVFDNLIDKGLYVYNAIRWTDINNKTPDIVKILITGHEGVDDPYKFTTNVLNTTTEVFFVRVGENTGTITRMRYLCEYKYSNASNAPKMTATRWRNVIGAAFVTYNTVAHTQMNQFDKHFWTRLDEHNDVRTMSSGYKNIIFYPFDVASQNSTILRNQAYNSNNHFNRAFLNLLNVLSVKPFVDFVIFDTTTGLDAVNVRYVKETGEMTIRTDVVYGVSTDISTFKIKNIQENETATFILPSKISFRDLQTFNPDILQGAALGTGLAAVGGGIQGGLNWNQNQQIIGNERDRWESMLQNNKDLFTQGQSNWLKNSQQNRDLSELMHSQDLQHDSEESLLRHQRSLEAFGVRNGAQTAGIGWMSGGIQGGNHTVPPPHEPYDVTNSVATPTYDSVRNKSIASDQTPSYASIKDSPQSSSSHSDFSSVTSNNPTYVNVPEGEFHSSDFTDDRWSKAPPKVLQASIVKQPLPSEKL